MKTAKPPIDKWELYYVPCAAAHKGRAAFLRKYPKRDLRYGVEARWSDYQTTGQTGVVAVATAEALRGFVLHNRTGDRLYTGPERAGFEAAKRDALQYIRDTPDCYLSLEYRLKQHVWQCPLGYKDGAIIKFRTTTEQDIIDWIVKLKDLTDKLK